MKPFEPNANQTLKNYYEVPVDGVESAETLVDWAVAAAAVSQVVVHARASTSARL